MKELLSVLSAVLLVILLIFISDKSDGNPFMAVVEFFLGVFLFLLVCMGFYNFYNTIFKDEERNDNNL